MNVVMRSARGSSAPLKISMGVLALVACGSADPEPAQPPASEAADEQARCPADTPSFSVGPDTGLLAVGKRLAVQGRIVDAQPAEPERFENDWTVRLLDASGAPQDDIMITDACAYMPVHAHGAAPKELRKTGPATFMLSGLNLFMRGPWEVQLAVSSAATGASGQETTNCDRERRRGGSDLVIFRACIADD